MSRYHRLTDLIGWREHVDHVQPPREAPKSNRQWFTIADITFHAAFIDFIFFIIYLFVYLFDLFTCGWFYHFDAIQRCSVEDAGWKGPEIAAVCPYPITQNWMNEIKTKQYPTRYGFEHRNKMNTSARLFEINFSFVTNSGRGSLLFLLLLLPDQLPVKTTWFAQRLVRPHLHAKGKKEKKFCQLFTF